MFYSHTTLTLLTVITLLYSIISGFLVPVAALKREHNILLSKPSHSNSLHTLKRDEMFDTKHQTYHSSNLLWMSRNVTITEDPVVNEGQLKMELSIIVKNNTVDDVLVDLIITCLTIPSSTIQKNWGISQLDPFSPIMTQVNMWVILPELTAQKIAKTTDTYIRNGLLSKCLSRDLPQFDDYSSAFAGQTIKASDTSTVDEQSKTQVWIIGLIIGGIAFLAFVAFIVSIRMMKDNGSENNNNRSNSSHGDEGSESDPAMNSRNSTFVIDMQNSNSAVFGAAISENQQIDEIAGGEYFTPVSVPRPGQIQPAP